MEKITKEEEVLNLANIYFKNNKLFKFRLNGFFNSYWSVNYFNISKKILSNVVVTCDDINYIGPGNDYFHLFFKENGKLTLGIPNYDKSFYHLLEIDNERMIKMEEKKHSYPISKFKEKVYKVLIFIDYYNNLDKIKHIQRTFKDVYYSPYTEIGKRRLEKSYQNLVDSGTL